MQTAMEVRYLSTGLLPAGERRESIGIDRTRTRDSNSNSSGTKAVGSGKRYHIIVGTSSSQSVSPIVTDPLGMQPQVGTRDGDLSCLLSTARHIVLEDMSLEDTRARARSQCMDQLDKPLYAFSIALAARVRAAVSKGNMDFNVERGGGGGGGDVQRVEAVDRLLR